MVGLKITPNNVKLIKLWFFIKFMNFFKNSEILTQDKTSYWTFPINFFKKNLITQSRITNLFLHNTSKKILIKS